MVLFPDQCNQEKFAKDAATIALHNFHWQYATFVLFNSTLVCSVDIFLRSYQKNVFVGRGTFYPGFVKRTQQYVIFGADVPDIVHMLTWMQRHQFDNTGTYIVVCLSERLKKCNEAHIVDVLWNFKIINVVLINNREGTTTHGFTYHEPEDCKNIRATHLKYWDSCFSSDYKHCQNMYPLKLKNLHGCPITVSTFNQVPYMNLSNGIPTGADGDLLRVIAKTMNFTLMMMTPRIGFGWGKYVDNGTWTGSLADVYNEWANFSMTSASITLSRFAIYQISTDYAVVSVAWVSHPPDLLPSSLKLLRPFKLHVRLALTISFIIIVLIKLILKTNFLECLKQLNVTTSYDTIFSYWESCMGLPMSFFPANKALLCLAVLWIWYCLIIRTLYQVYLINSLQTDVYDPELETIEEFIASEYSFGGGLALKDYFIDNALVYDGWKNVESVDIYPTMIKLSQGLKFVLAMSKETSKMFLSTNPDKKLYILPRVIITGPTAIFFKKYSPLVHPLNIILFRLREAGVIQKIYRDNTGKKVLKEVLEKNIPIAMEHYAGCYAILLTGWILAGTCFFVEILITQKRRNQ